MLVLHGNEFGPAVLVGTGLHHGELVGPHAAGADVADFAAFDEVVERFHGFFDGGMSVEAVDLEKVHVVSFEAFKGCVDGVEDGGAREAYYSQHEWLMLSR